MAILAVTLYSSQFLIILLRFPQPTDWDVYLDCVWYVLRAVPATMENTIRHKPEVETVPQTGSANNLVMKTDIDAISMAIPMFFLRGGEIFADLYANLTRRFLTLNFNMADGYRK